MSVLKKKKQTNSKITNSSNFSCSVYVAFAFTFSFPQMLFRPLLWFYKFFMSSYEKKKKRIKTLFMIWYFQIQMM